MFGVGIITPKYLACNHSHSIRVINPFPIFISYRKPFWHEENIYIYIYIYVYIYEQVYEKSDRTYHSNDESYTYHTYIPLSPKGTEKDLILHLEEHTNFFCFIKINVLHFAVALRNVWGIMRVRVELTNLAKTTVLHIIQWFNRVLINIDLDDI